MRKKSTRPAAAAAMLLTAMWLATPAHATQVRNVIVLIPDGMSQSVVTLGRLYRGENLALDEIASGMVNTSMANSIITGSAAAGTAFSTGYKTTEPFIGLAPRPDDAISNYTLPMDVPGASEADRWDWLAYRPLATVLEGAKLKGKSTGLVATSRISHATPAAFGAHVDNRNNENEITRHLVYQNLDVAFGGGSRHLLPNSAGGSRTDGENLRQVLLDRGYAYVETAQELATVRTTPVWGMFASSHMMPDLDRRYLLENGHRYPGNAAEQAQAEPSLAEMTAKAIELLSQNRSGFFLMVEGSQVDWAGHATDPAYKLQDFLAFDDAVRVALDFAEKDRQTMIIVVPDHNTGALTLGNFATSSNYTSTSVEKVIDPLKGMKVTAGFIAAQLPRNPGNDDIRQAVQNYWGISLTEDDANAIRSAAASVGMTYAIGRVVSERHTIFGWSTHGHTGEDVPLWSFGPGAPRGYLDNTEIAQAVAKAFGLNLSLTHPAGLNQRLFVDVHEHFPEAVVDRSNPQKPVIRMGEWHMSSGTDLLYRNDQSCQMEGLAVYVPRAANNQGRAFVPAQAIELMQNSNQWQRHCGSHLPNLGQSIRDRVQERLSERLGDRFPR
nr:alkaline phosphatase [Ectothiorhodospira shaposhnikovii]